MGRAWATAAVPADRVRCRVGHAGAVDPRRPAPPRVATPAARRRSDTSRSNRTRTGWPTCERRFETAGLTERLVASSPTLLPGRRPRRSPCPSPASSLPTSSSTPCRSTASSFAAAGCSSCSWPGRRPLRRRSRPSRRPRSWPRAWPTMASASWPRARSAEICLGLDPWLDEVAARLARGFVLVIDYGYPAGRAVRPAPPRRHAAGLSRPSGRRRSVRGRRPDGPHGSRRLHRGAAARGAARVPGRRRPRDAAGVPRGRGPGVGAAGAPGVAGDRPSTDYLRARSGIVRMLDPRHMGRFRVLTLSRG